MRTKNLTGKRLGNLVVKEEFSIKKSNRNRIYCLCICDCGNEYCILKANILRKKLCGMNCGCQKPKGLLTKDKLYTDYIELNMTAQKIAEKYGVSNRIVKEYIKIYDLTNIKKKGSGKEYCKSIRKGYGEISGSYLCSCRHHAIQRNMKWEVTEKYLWELFLKQERLCVYTGTELFFPEKFTARERTSQTASLDRIDSSRGYINENVQWVHKDIQRMKWQFTETKFLDLVNTIYQNQTRKTT